MCRGPTTMHPRPRKNIVQTIGPSVDQTTSLQAFLGGLCLFGFLTTWIASVASPGIIGWCLFHKRYLLASPLIALVVAAYVPWKRGFLSDKVHRFVNHYTPCYIKNLTIVYEGGYIPSPKDPQTFFAVHPHGAFCIGWAMMFINDAFQHVRFCFSNVLFLSPLFRLFTRSIGIPGSASKEAMIDYLEKGDHLGLLPGGFEEATLSCIDQDRIFLQKRTGFIRLCLQYGIQVRPTYVFGERQTYWNIQGAFPFRLRLNRYGIPTIFTLGYPFLPLLPKPNVNLYIVVGEPISLPKIDNPSKEDVLKWHKKYSDSLKRIFEDHKENAYGVEVAKTTKLEVW